MSTRTIVLAVTIAALVVVIVTGWLTADAAGEHLEPATTTDTTPPTTWLETQPRLGDGFDELLAGVARAKAAHRPKRNVTAAKAVATIQRPATTGYDVARLEQIIRDGFARFGAAVAEEAVDQAWCETGGTLDPNSTGDEGEVGLLQIHPRYHTGRAAKFGWTMADLYDPYKNVVVGADIYAESGWGPWTCQP